MPAQGAWITMIPHSRACQMLIYTSSAPLVDTPKCAKFMVDTLLLKEEDGGGLGLDRCIGIVIT